MACTECCVTFSLGTVGTNPIALAGSGNRGRRGPASGAAAQLAAENRIPSFKIGGSVRFDPAAFAVWLRQKIAPASVHSVQSQSSARRVS
jgi:hypothetical protein